MLSAVHGNADRHLRAFPVQVLETILDDDHDMHDMYLARREMLAKEEAEAEADMASLRSSTHGSEGGQGPNPSADPYRIRWVLHPHVRG